ncbi:MAG: PIN domain-containing protein [Candidatus Bathyarchaeia archaeon]|nr:type II toxin-antitoxin system VapC family toxin [Candidatus Bathyarchaeota archaeon]
MKPEKSGRGKPLDKVVLIDSNIFLEVELAESHADACKQFLRKVRDGLIKSAITDFHIDSIAIVMENYGKSWRDIALFLASLLRYKGLMIYPVGLGARIKSTSIMRDYGLDYDDALAAQALKDLSTSVMISYDEDFDLVNWIKRYTPEELI